MAPERWRRVREVFERALDEAPTDVPAWVARQVGDDPDIASEVMSLLQHHSRAGEFLAKPMDQWPDLLDEGPSLAAGAAIGPYTIVRELGRGGMGRVYLAHDARLGRTVALKALAPSMTRDSAQRERLRREARAAASLTHPGICTIYALEEIGDEIFIAAEYVDGETLRDEIASGRRPTPDELAATARALADALASAHARGIVHRDLKPENVMRGREGRLKILDFGLASMDPAISRLASEPRVTLPGAVLGTPAYMSPEQLNGLPADSRSDVFALGVVLFEYATGVHPFEAETAMALVARVLEGAPPPVQDLRPDVPRPIVAAIDRCLQKRPADRYASAGDLVRALDRGEARPPAPGVATWWRYHQAAAIGLYVVAAGLAWWIKEWQHGVADSGFLIISVAAMVSGVLRGHLVFTERVNRPSFDAERRRAGPITCIVDLLIALVLAAEGWRIAPERPVAGALTIALAVGIALTRIVIERSTTRAAFGA